MGERTVSIVMPVHNGEKFLRRSVECIQNQTYQDFILYMIEDGSTDGSLKLMEELAATDDRLRVLVNESDRHSAAVARNIGILAAQTDYLAFFDNDDWWAPEKLEKEMAFMEEKDAAFVFCNYEFADSDLNPDGRVVHVPETITYKEALKNTTIFTSTVLLNFRKFDRKLAIMPDMHSEDTATWWAILRTIPCAYGLTENLVLYRQSAGSESSNKLRMVARIWLLYRTQAHLNVFSAAWHMLFWAYHATKRRVKKEQK